MRIIRWLSFLVFLANCADAQLGQDESACRQYWGSPLSTNDSSAHTLCLSYRGPASLSVNLSFIDGLVRRASYEKQGLAAADVQYLLRLNEQDRRWDKCVTPGSAGDLATGGQWMRSDEMAMASLSSNQITIVAAEWNCSPAAENSSAVTNAIPESTNSTTSAVASGNEARIVTVNRPLADQKPPPHRVPARGDSKQKAINLLGSPSGTIMGGSKEALVYPWGNVWLTNGIVTVIEYIPW